MSLLVRKLAKPNLKGYVALLAHGQDWSLLDVCESAEAAEAVLRHELSLYYRGHGVVAQLVGLEFASPYNEHQAKAWRKEEETHQPRPESTGFHGTGGAVLEGHDAPEEEHQADLLGEEK